MLTFKQLEALFWVAHLGGFSPAAHKLHTTQSAISKRIQELEGTFGTSLFDRSLRTARLTEKGEEMYSIAKRLLEQRDAAVEQFTSPEVIERRLRLGVTELTAMTWLSQLVSRIQAYYPRVAIEPDVDMSASLRDKLLADEVDVIIVPDVFEDHRFASRQVGTVENAWMCKPGYLDVGKPLRVHELAKHQLLIQGNRSGTGMLYDQWLKSVGINSAATLSCNSLVALISLTVSGLGVSYLPKACMRPLTDAGVLAVIKTVPALPQARYVALFKSEQRSGLIASIVMLAQETCDISQILQLSSQKQNI